LRLSPWLDGLFLFFNAAFSSVIRHQWKLAHFIVISCACVHWSPEI